jgi:nucleotidyltransferase/DNA polymerase involved in DNA repair
MQACLENTTPPLVGSTSLPLHKSRSLPSVDNAPAWTIRVARREADRNELAKELLEVPKAALRQVFGKVLGTRLWQQNRAAAATPSTNAKPAPIAISPTAPISDADISSGMLRYLCNQTAATLREHQRFAKSIVLTVQYSDGESETVRQPLPQTANDAASLETAARLALRRMRTNIFVSLKLDVTATASTQPSSELAAATEPLTRVA